MIFRIMFLDICTCCLRSFRLLIMNLICMVRPWSAESCILIESNISASLDLPETRNVDSICFRWFTVANKYPLPDGSSFDLFSLGTCIYTGQPNILRWLTYGFSPENISSGVLFPSTLWGLLFCTYTTVLAAFAHRCIDKSWSWIITFTASIMVQFFLCATPFCWGL